MRFVFIFSVLMSSFCFFPSSNLKLCGCSVCASAIEKWEVFNFKLLNVFVELLCDRTCGSKPNGNGTPLEE